MDGWMGVGWGERGRWEGGVGRKKGRNCNIRQQNKPNQKETKHKKERKKGKERKKEEVSQTMVFYAQSAGTVTSRR